MSGLCQMLWTYAVFIRVTIATLVRELWKLSLSRVQSSINQRVLEAENFLSGWAFPWCWVRAPYLLTDWINKPLSIIWKKKKKERMSSPQKLLKLKWLCGWGIGGCLQSPELTSDLRSCWPPVRSPVLLGGARGMWRERVPRCLQGHGLGWALRGSADSW